MTYATAPSPEGQPPEQQPPRPAAGNSAHMIGALGAVAALSGLLLVMVYQATLPIIEANREALLQEAIFDVLPGAESRAAFVIRNGAPPAELEEGQALGDADFYAGFDADGVFAGVALRASAQGYQDVIRALFGYDPNAQEIIGFRVMENRETPGLGDKIAWDPEFLANFDGLQARINPDTGELDPPIRGVQEGAKTQPHEVDGISGATISVDAVVTMLNRAVGERVPYILEHLDIIEGAR